MTSTFFIVAGGPSLKGYDFTLLKNKRVIAVNRAFQVLPNAEIVYFSDMRFFHWFKDELLYHPGRKISGSKIDHPAVEKYRFSGLKGLDTRPNNLRTGNNSTYAAMNLAYHLGAKTIILLGLDMVISDPKVTHWHDGYQTTNLQRHLDKMSPYFPSIAEPLEACGVKVYNANMDSAVECFEKIPRHLAHLIE